MQVSVPRATLVPILIQKVQLNVYLAPFVMLERTHLILDYTIHSHVNLGYFDDDGRGATSCENVWRPRQFAKPCPISTDT